MPNITPERLREIERGAADEMDAMREWIKAYGVISTESGLRCQECNGRQKDNDHDVLCQRGKWLKEGE